VRFGDGTSAAEDLLIGADGIHSPVRTLIDPGASAPRYTGLTIACGYSPAPRPAACGGGNRGLRDVLRQPRVLRLRGRARRPHLVVRPRTRAPPAPGQRRGEQDSSVYTHHIDWDAKVGAGGVGANA
jgi:2-polyprenyl-6-methoxyphenol hydroxylase-like FAD-dependent oxidoreductase